MKNVLMLSGFFLMGALASIQVTNFHHKQNLSLNKSVVRLAAARKPNHEPLFPGINKSLDKESIADKVAELPLEKDSFEELIYATDRMNRLATEAMVQRLRANDPGLIVSLFQDQLKELGSDHAAKRSQLVFAANLLQEDQLLSFWKDLALRLTPGSPHEAEAMGLSELTVDAKVIHGEMAAAVRNLGLIAYRDPAAKVVLEQIVLHPQPLSHPTFVREYAFYALKEADENAVLRILRGLPKADPLRIALQSSVAGE